MSKPCLRSISLVLLVASLFCPSLAHAADVAVESGQTLTATQNLGTDSVATVEEGGAVDVSTYGDEAIRGTDDNVVYNWGTIASLNSGAGIHFENGNTIFNYGTIETSAATPAITSGDAIDLHGGGNAVFNWGTIRVFDSINGYAIHISGGTGNSITNYGTIETTGQGSNAIHVETASNTIINHGTITTAGNTGDAIYFTGGNTLISSGTIISLNDDVLHLSGSGSDIHLLAGSAIYGDIDLHDSSDHTFDIGNGLNAMLTFENYLPDTIGTNGMPFVIDEANLQLAVVDPTGFAMAEDLLADITDAAFAAISTRLRRHQRDLSRTVALSPSLNVTPAADVPTSPTWGALFGSWRDQSASGITWSAAQHLSGLVAGFDRAITTRSRAGLFFGAAKADLEVDDDAQAITTENFWGGAYWSRTVSRYRFDLAALAGWQANDSTRRMVDNTVMGGVDYADADYSGFFVSPEASFSRAWQLAGGPIESTFTLRYAGLFLEAYEEEGSNADLSVNQRNVHSLTAKGELLRPLVGTLAGDGFHLDALVGAEGRYSFGDEVSAVLLTDTISFDPDDRSFTLASFAGAEAGYTLPSGALSIDLSGQAAAGSDGALIFAARLKAELLF